MDYKKYSLENLENWLHDAMSSGEATPQEIYDVIKGVVEENYYTYKEQTAKAYELLSLLNGNGKGHIKSFDDCVDKVLSRDEEAYDAVMREKEYYEPSMPPWGHSDLEYMVHNSPKKCDKDDPSPECKGAWNDFWDQVDNDVKEDIKEHGYEWTPIPSKDVPYPLYMNKNGDVCCPDPGWSMTDDGIWMPPQKEDKVVKWQLPVEVDGLTGDCYVNLPDDLLERAGLLEGDVVEWIDRGDGSFEMRKVNGAK